VSYQILISLDQMLINLLPLYNVFFVSYLMATSSRIMHHVTKHESFQIGFLNMTLSTKMQHKNCYMAPTVEHRESLGCGVTGASCPACASHKSPSTARCYPINMGQQCFQHLVESMPRKAVLKANRVKHSIRMFLCSK